MKIIKRLVALAVILCFLFTAVGCYFISSQKMRNLKGTYKLSHYTYTPSYERREGYTPRTYDYIADEEYLYEDYLIITGSVSGYYVHKQAGEEPYVKEVTLKYEYDSEDSSKVSYVVFNDAITVNSDSGFNRMGVSKNGLNYSKTAIDYTELFTKRPMRSESLSIRWEKVSRDTDLGYVEEQLGSLRKYDYRGFAVRGIYKLDDGYDANAGVFLDTPYHYYYYVIDTAEGELSATAYYAMKETPEVRETRTVSIERDAEDWSLITVDGRQWTIDPMLSRQYYNESDGVRTTLSCVSNDISDSSIDSMTK